MSQFSLVIASIDKTYFQGQASYLGITTPQGALGLEAHHENFMATLTPDSDLVYAPENGPQRTIRVKSASLSFIDNKAVVTLMAGPTNDTR